MYVPANLQDTHPCRDNFKAPARQFECNIQKVSVLPAGFHHECFRSLVQRQFVTPHEAASAHESAAAALGASSQLTRLHVYHFTQDHAPSDIPWCCAVGASSLPQLKEVIIGGSPPAPAELLQLSGLSSLTQLQLLDVSLSDAATASLLHNMSGLKEFFSL
jgi:hypothetical protein